MASTIITKKGSGVPTSGDLVHGELAVDTVNKRLYTENAGGTVLEIGTAPSTIDINAGTIDGTVIGGSSAAAGTFTTLTASGEITANGGIALGDNDKATFGDGDDLQIYHDGTNSYITDGGTGDLNLLGSNLNLKSGSGAVTYASGSSATGAFTLYKGTAKLSTTDAGIDVTGTVTADGLTLETDGPSIAFEDTAGGNNTDMSITVNGGVMDFKNSDNSQNIMRLNSTGDLSLFEDTGTTAKFFWDASAESLGIGTSSPLNPLDVVHSDTTAESGNVASFRTSSGGYFYIQASDKSISNPTWTLGSATNEELAFSSNNSEAMRIDSSGNVGIGTSSPSNILDVKKDTPAFTQTSSSAAYYTSLGTNVDYTKSFVLNNKGSEIVTYGDDTAYGLSLNGGAANLVKVTTNGTERMRIDSSGNLLVGKTSNDNTTAGAVLRSTGQISGARSDNAAGIFNRLTSDGDIVDFRKDGTTVGSIGVQSSGVEFYIDGAYNANRSGIEFGYQALIPRLGQANSNGTTSLGSSSARFKDLYLSGGVYLGGTGAANLLDDYETGTFTPELADASSGGNTATATHKFGHYTKVGNLVTIWMHFRNIDTTGMTSGNALYITGLPFTADNNLYTAGSLSTDRVSFSGNYLTFAVTENAAYGPISIISSNAQDAGLTVAGIDGTGSDIQGVCVQYRTA